MKKLDRLIELASGLGYAVSVIEIVPQLEAFSNYRIKYFIPSLAIKKFGLQPIEEHCRDKLDYELRMKQWMNSGVYSSPLYPTFDRMISEEIKRLENENSV